MRQYLIALLATFTLLPAAGHPEGTAGDFDYYVLALSWSPNWCLLEGDSRNSPQCDDREDFGWVLHGLWPQYEQGWPDYCRTGFSPPSERQTELMVPLMGSSGSAWHQWRKHGVCSGLRPLDYYTLAATAFAKVVKPEVFRRLQQEVRLPASVIQDAFLAENPDLGADGITITCRAGRIQEARICLSRDLEFRDCGADVIRDCTLTDAVFSPIR